MSIIDNILDAISSECASILPTTGVPAQHIDEDKVWKNGNKLDTFARYRELIRVNHITSIEKLAKIVDKPVPQVLTEIQSMLNNKYVVEMHIDSKTNSIAPGDAPAQQLHLEQNMYNFLDPFTIWSIAEDKLWLNADKYAAFAQYRELIRDNNITSVNQIAEIVKKPFLQTQLEIQSMIFQKYIVGVHVDIKTGTIVPGDDPNPVPIICFDKTATPSQVIVCKGCGAINPSTSSKCEYCGSDLR